MKKRMLHVDLILVGILCAGLFISTNFWLSVVLLGGLVFAFHEVIVTLRSKRKDMESLKLSKGFQIEYALYFVSCIGPVAITILTIINVINVTTSFVLIGISTASAIALSMHIMPRYHKDIKSLESYLRSELD